MVPQALAAEAVTRARVIAARARAIGAELKALYQPAALGVSALDADRRGAGRGAGAGGRADPLPAAQPAWPRRRRRPKPVESAAQEPLRQAEAAITRGRLAEARAMLLQLLSKHPRRGPGALPARQPGVRRAQAGGGAGGVRRGAAPGPRAARRRRHAAERADAAGRPRQEAGLGCADADHPAHRRPGRSHPGRDGHRGPPPRVPRGRARPPAATCAASTGSIWSRATAWISARPRPATRSARRSSAWPPPRARGPSRR